MIASLSVSSFFFFNDTATTEIYTLSLHDALPIWAITVGSNMARATPGAGNEGPMSGLIKLGDIRLIHAGDDARFALIAGRSIGAATLLRFYVLHCVAIPLVAGFLMAIHFWRVRKDGGISGPL